MDDTNYLFHAGTGYEDHNGRGHRHTNVPAGVWYTSAVAYGTERGLVSGIGGRSSRVWLPATPCHALDTTPIDVLR